MNTQSLAHDGLILCVDFDGTLYDEYDATVGGVPKTITRCPHPDLIPALNLLYDNDWYIIVNSCRSTLDYETVKRHCDFFGLKYHQIALGVKPVADVYLDDKGWLPRRAEDVLNEVERRQFRNNWFSYYDALVGEDLTSPFAHNIYTIPETGATPDDERDDSFHVLIPFTGGMDSWTLVCMARESGVPYHLLYFHFGQPYAYDEIETCERLLSGSADSLEVINHLSLGFTHHDHILTGRNAIILLECQRYARQHGWWGEVWFGVLGGESPTLGGDKSRRFLQDIQAMLLPELRLVTPLIGWDKTDIVRYHKARGNDALAQLRSTKSCFSADSHQCGRCQTCFRKFVAFAAAGENPATLFPDGYDFAPFVKKYRMRMAAAWDTGDFSHYSPARVKDTLQVINSYFGSGVTPSLD